MKKRVFGLLFALLLALSLTLPAVASQAQLNYITDEAGILTEQEWQTLETMAAELSEGYRCGLYVIILSDYMDFGSDPESVCYNLYEDYTLGYGRDRDAIVLLMSMYDRDFWINDYGAYGEGVMTSYGRGTLEDAMLDDFANDDWYSGLADYLGQCDNLLRAAESGEPVGSSDGSSPLTAYLIAFVVAVIIAFIVCSIFKAQMKTAVRATSADHYVTPGGVEMRIREDRYTHTTRRERKIERSSSSSDGNSGGGGKF